MSRNSAIVRVSRERRLSLFTFCRQLGRLLVQLMLTFLCHIRLDATSQTLRHFPTTAISELITIQTSKGGVKY